MATNSHYPETKVFQDAETGELHSLTPTIWGRPPLHGCGLELDPPVEDSKEAISILKGAGAVLVYEKDDQGQDTDKVNTVYLTPSYAAIFVSPRSEDARGNLLTGVRDRVGSLLEGTAWEMTSEHRLDHQLQ